MENRKRTSIRLGAQVAEVEALYTAALTAETPELERRHLNDLSRAATRLTDLARTSASEGLPVEPLPPPPSSAPATGNPRIRGRIAHAERIADRIILRMRSR